MRIRKASETLSGCRKARDAVIFPTPARVATSAIVGLPLVLRLLILQLVPMPAWGAAHFAAHLG
jgi:hypothetical protein